MHDQPGAPSRESTGSGLWPARSGVGGHRGAFKTDWDRRPDWLPPDAPAENTLDSLRLAKSLGADFAEVDAVTTADGAAVLLHCCRLDDHFFERAHVPGSSCSSIPFPELAKLATGPARNGKLCTLDEAFDFACEHFRSGPFSINVELKGHIGAGLPWDGPALCAAARASLLRSRIPPERVLFSSFCLANLRQMRDAVPNAQFAALFSEAPDPRPLYSDKQNLLGWSALPFETEYLDRAIFELGCKKFSGALSFVCPEASRITLPALLRLRHFGLGMNVWHRSPDFDPGLCRLIDQNCRSLGIDCAFITDHIEQTRSLLENPAP